MSTATATLICPELLLTTPGGPRLLGSRCRACGEPYFPATRNCTRCLATDQEPLDLGNEGRLWSWTVQSFAPKSPYDGATAERGFSPYGVGYIELASGLKVEARLTESDPAKLQIGMPMRLIVEEYSLPPDTRSTFAFSPI